MSGLSPGIRRSLYHASTPQSRSYPALETHVAADVAIVGAGYTGLSTALHLLEGGASAVVVEAQDVGWGASGRNGGQVNPGLKSEPSEILDHFGKEIGTRLVRLAGNAPAYVFDLIRRHGIDCAALNSGSIRVVRREGERGVIERSVRDWAAFGVRLEPLDRRKLEEVAGTAAYPAGVLDRRGGQLNPLAYARGLADAAARLGGLIFVGSPAVALERRNGGWRVVTPRGVVDAGAVVLAANGYTDGLWPGLRRTVVPVYSAIAATDPLPADLLARILPGRPVLYESSWRVLYFRVDDQGRFLMGGPSVLRETDDERRYAHLPRRAGEIYPALAGQRWSHFWNGQVAVTKDHYPHLHELAPGLTAALGYNGRGVAMATALGGLVAKRILGAPAAELELPVTPMQPFALHPMWKLAVAGRRLLGWTKDRLQGTN